LSTKFADTVFDAIKIAKKHNISETKFLYWVFLENLANEMMLALYRDYGEKLIQAIKDWATHTGVPMSPSQLKTYRERMKSYLEEFKK